MKFSLALFVLSAASVNAFAPSISTTSTSTALFATVDTRSAVRQALDISKKFGVTSPEARVAWDAVEEMRANDDRYVCRGCEWMCATASAMCAVCP